MQKSFQESKPSLYIVSTPIGNLKDMTFRAVEILKEVDLILAEDTRTSSVLMAYHQIKKPLMSYHEFNKNEKEDQIISFLQEGKNIALISDAGTPGISDPGYEIIKRVIDEGYHVISIPGASAMLAALVTSGLIIQPFTFIGFLPRKVTEQKMILESYKGRMETLVIYEAPSRVSKTLEVIHQVLGDRRLSIHREMTKAFETIIRTTLSEALTMEMNPKGEYVLIIEGKEENQEPMLDVVEHYEELIKAGYPSKEAMRIVGQAHQLSKNDVYKRVKIERKIS